VKEGYEQRRLTDLGINIRPGFWGEGSLGFAQELSSVVWRISTGGTGLLGVLGTEAKISIWYLGAR